MWPFNNSNWKCATEGVSCFQLLHDDIHIWSVSLEQSLECREILSLTLSLEEHQRARKFYFEKDRIHYIVGRGLLRKLLGRYLGLDPSALEFEYGLHGKPLLATRFSDKIIEFNLSHSKDRAIYIFNWDQPIGVDIEYSQPLKDMDDFALQFFTSNECKLIHSLPKEQKPESFYKIWTCKEAFLKANGSGLTVPINQVEVAIHPNGTASLASIGGDQSQAENWRLELFSPSYGYQSALAIEKHGGQIAFHTSDKYFFDGDF